MTSRQRDIGAYLKHENALNPVTVTAGTTADGQERNGHIIDRRAFADILLSAKVGILYDGAIATTAKTIIVASNLQHSLTTESTAFADYVDKTGTTGFTVTETRTTAGNGAPSDVLEYDVDLSSARRFLRIQVTPTLSSSVTDTVDLAAVITFGGADQNPAN